MEDILRQLWAYFENSPKRLAVLLKMQIEIKKCSLQLKEKSKQLLVKRMKKACSTRWLSFDRSVAALYQEYEAVLHTLKALDEDGCATAHGLFNRLKEGKFLGVQRPASPFSSFKAISRRISSIPSSGSNDKCNQS